MKTFIIVGADVITPTNSEPFVGLTVNLNGKQERIARTCKQAVLDLHKSARGSKLPEKLFDNGYASANTVLVRQFANEIISLVGKTGFGDVTPYKAGDTYEATADSLKVKAGVAQVGDILTADKDGSRVEGFLSFPLTQDELMRRDLIAELSSSMAISFGAMLGFAPPSASTGTTNEPKTAFEEPKEKEFVDPATEAIGTAPKGNAKAK